MGDPAAVLRAAADLAEQRARVATSPRWRAFSDQDEWDGWHIGNGKEPIASMFIGSEQPQADAEHIAAADPAFMRKRAEEWRRAADLIVGSLGGALPELIAEISLPSALAYLRQEDQP